MMTRIQLLLGKIAEECNEVAQRALKAQQFGLDEVQDGQVFPNSKRLTVEMRDLLSVCRMLEDEADDIGLELTFLTPATFNANRVKVEKFIKLSQKRGMVETDE